MSESLVSIRLLVDPCNYVMEELIIVYTPSLEKLILQEKGNGPKII
jgi:cyanate lyase